MNNSRYRLIGFISLPFLILYTSWWIIGESFNEFIIQVVNSVLTNLLIVLGFATLCSWWFCLTRGSKIIIPITLTTTFTILFLISYYLLSSEILKPSGLNTPVAILLNTSLESLTLLLSFVFVLLIGILITNEPNLEEE
tara:strand:+ start:2276 stop:2692 length:417 start_codon:yes stop_codon:yes gene_type:complete